MKAFFIAGGIVLAAALAFAILPLFQERHSLPRTADINGRKLQLEIADTPETRFQGLSDRESLCGDCGMLFAFEAPGNQTFVMRRMHFPLDIIWLRNGQIVKINRNLPPEHAEPYTPYVSGEPVDQVLELNGGGAEAYDLNVGDTLKLIY